MADEIVRAMTADGYVKAVAVTGRDLVERARNIHTLLPMATAALGRTLLEGVKSVKLFGEEIAVHAQIVNFQGLSSHADRNHLLSWIQAIQAPKPQHVFVVHGDREVAPFFAKTIQGLGFTAHAPQYTEVYDLIADKVTEPGYLPERKARTTGGMRASAAYERLVAVGNMLMESIKRSRGRDNKSLARFADQLRQLLEKWES